MFKKVFISAVATLSLMGMFVFAMPAEAARFYYTSTNVSNNSYGWGHAGYTGWGNSGGTSAHTYYNTDGVVRGCVGGARGWGWGYGGYGGWGGWGGSSQRSCY